MKCFLYFEVAADICCYKQGPPLLCSVRTDWLDNADPHRGIPWSHSSGTLGQIFILSHQQLGAEAVVFVRCLYPLPLWHHWLCSTQFVEIVFTSSIRYFHSSHHPECTDSELMVCQYILSSFSCFISQLSDEKEIKKIHFQTRLWYLKRM